MPTAEVLDTKERQGDHSGVVIDVQERHMVLPFPQDKEDRV